MKFLYSNIKALKNGLYVDYFFKNIIFIFYKKIFGSIFVYSIDKYLTENFFYMIKKFFSFFLFISEITKKLTFTQLLKISLLIIIQFCIIVLI
jgi:hypothetical protein